MKKYLLLLLFSISFLFANNGNSSNLRSAYFAGGCFWGVEHHFEKKEGVKDAISGYMGGWVKNPGYYDVVNGKTGHVETVKVVYDPKVVSFEELTKLFFEIHDMEQKDGQGPDIGSQYLSVVFYNNKQEKKIIQNIVNILTKKGYKVATSLVKVTPFYKAEDFHQDYYEKTGKLPYCHIYKKIF
jgi:methionine-S-sulfoxide reductase